MKGLRGLGDQEKTVVSIHQVNAKDQNSNEK